MYTTEVFEYRVRYEYAVMPWPLIISPLGGPTATRSGWMLFRPPETASMGALSLSCPWTFSPANNKSSASSSHPLFLINFNFNNNTITPEEHDNMDAEKISPDQEVDFCTLGMFIIGTCYLSPASIFSLYAVHSLYFPSGPFIPGL